MPAPPDFRANVMPLVTPASGFGLAAAAVPIGFGPAGMPLGMQLIAADGDASSVFALGRAFQACTTWHRRTPDARFPPSRATLRRDDRTARRARREAARDGLVDAVQSAVSRRIDVRRDVPARRQAKRSVVVARDVAQSAAAHRLDRADVEPFVFEQRALRGAPKTYPPIVASPRTTRWHGISSGTGLRASALPTARVASGAPISRASQLYGRAWPRSICARLLQHAALERRARREIDGHVDLVTAQTRACRVRDRVGFDRRHDLAPEAIAVPAFEALGVACETHRGHAGRVPRDEGVAERRRHAQ